MNEDTSGVQVIPVKDVQTFSSEAPKKLQHMQSLVGEILIEARKVAEETKDFSKVEFLEREIITRISEEATRKKSELNLGQVAYKPYLANEEERKKYEEEFMRIKNSFIDHRPDDFKNEINALYENYWKGKELVDKDENRKTLEVLSSKVHKTPVVSVPRPIGVGMEKLPA